MAIASTSIGTNTSTSGPTVAVTVAAGGVPAGALIVVCVGEISGTAVGQSVTDTAGNTYTSYSITQFSSLSAFGNLFYAYNVLALSSGNTITYTKDTSGDDVAITAFYATGVLRTGSPADGAGGASGSGTSPSTTSNLPSASGDLMVGFVAVKGPSSDTFTQDASFSTPPVRASSSNIYVAGGTLVIGAGTQAYAPTITSRAYGVMYALFKPAPAVPTSQGFIII